MTLFNIGPVEFIAILVIMFILLGPEGMVKTARSIGTWIRQIVRSPMWGEVLGYSREIRELPTKIVRESGLDEDLKEIQKAAGEATREAQVGIEEADKELKQSLKATGDIDVKVDTNQGKAKSLASANMASADGSPGVEPPPSEKPVVEEPKPPVVID